MINSEHVSAVEDAAWERWLFRLAVEGTLSHNLADALASRIHTAFPFERFAVAVIKLNESFSYDFDLGPVTAQRYAYKLAEAAAARIRSRFPCERLATGSLEFSIIANDASFNAGSMAELKLMLVETAARFEYAAGGRICIGVGMPAERLESVGTSYDQAREASQYHVALEEEPVFDYAQIEARDRQEAGYPIEIETLLVQSVRQGQGDRALNLLDRFVDEIGRGSVRDIHLGLLQLGGTVGCLPTPDAAGGFGRLSLRALERQLLAEHAIEGKRRVIAGLIEQQIERKHREDRQKRLAVGEAAIQYIADQFNRFDLSVETVAEHVGFSAGYLRRLFKEIYGCSPTDYIFNLRLETARRLLRDTDETAKTIAAMVGYANSKYFYNTFKKSIGLTTFEYREQSRSRRLDEP